MNSRSARNAISPNSTVATVSPRAQPIQNTDHHQPGGTQQDAVELAQFLGVQVVFACRVL
jgi:hypothetical protein